MRQLLWFLFLYGLASPSRVSMRSVLFQFSLFHICYYIGDANIWVRPLLERLPRTITERELDRRSDESTSSVFPRPTSTSWDSF